MSLVALLTEDGTLALWRVTSGLGGVIGVVASGFVLLDRLQTGQRGELAYLGHFLGGPLYVVVAWFALVPELADRGFGVPPLVVEAVVIALILLVDVHLAWSFFAAARLDPAAPAGQSPPPPQPGYPGPAGATAGPARSARRPDSGSPSLTGGVVFATGAYLRCPQGPAVGGGEDLDVAAVVAVRWVGPGRGAGLAASPFPRPARRTRRANYLSFIKLVHTRRHVDRVERGE